MDSEWTVDLSGTVSMVVGAKVGVGSAIVTAGGDVGGDTRLMVAGTCASGNADLAVEVQAETLVGSVLSPCVVVSEVSALVEVQHGVEVAEAKGYTGMGTVPSACATASEVLVLANAQLGIVMSEMETGWQWMCIWA